MKQFKLFPVLIVNIKNIFPNLLLWIKLPALMGWFALTLGIIVGYYAFSPNSIPLLFYNKTGLLTMFILGFISLISSSRLLRSLCFFSLGLCLIAHDFGNQYSEFSDWKKSVAQHKRCMLSGSIVSSPVLAKGNYSFVVKSDSLFVPQIPGVLKNKNLVCYSLQAPSLGGSIVLWGRYAPPRPSPNPGGFDSYLFAMSNNVWGTFFADSFAQTAQSASLFFRGANLIRAAVKTSLASVTNEEYRGILQAAFLNDQSDLTASMKDLFFKAGIYHLLALSGFNIAILAGAILAFLFLFPIKKEWKILISISVIWLYLFFIGFIPSLFRAVIMATIVAAAFLLQRKSYLLNSLGIAGIVWLCLSPFSLFLPSYQLSFVATFGLITLCPILMKAFKLPSIHSLAKAALSPLVSLIAVSLASFIATMPVLMYHFNQFYIFGLFANLFCVTLMSLSMWVALAGFMFQLFFPALAILCMHLAEWIIFIMIQGAGLVKYVPWTALQTGLYYPELYVLFSVFILGITLVNKTYYRKYFLVSIPLTCLLTIICLCAHSREKSAQVVSFSVKNSFLAAIKWPDRRVWIIGSGPESTSYSTYRRTILPWMQKLGPCKIDCVIFPNNPGNAVQFLEPLVISEHVKRIKSCDSTCVQDYNLRNFLKSYSTSLEQLKNNDVLPVAPECTCHVYYLPKTTTDHAAAFSIRIFNATVFLSNKPHPNADQLGATIFTFTPSKPLRIERAIADFHPFTIK